MHLLRVFGRIFSLAVTREAAHRANLLFSVIMTGVEIASSAAALAILFSRVQTLAGWRLEEALVLLGAYQLVSGLLETFVEPNLGWMVDRVANGGIDDLLLQPLPSLFTVSLGTCRPLRLAQVGLGLVIVVAGLARLGTAVTPVHGLGCLLLMLCGTVVAWAIRLLIASIVFWAPGLEASVLFFAVWQLGRYPVHVYNRAVRWLLTYVFPVALVATLPAQALTRGVSPGVLLGGLTAALGAGLVASLVWRAGLRRYTGATS